MGNDVKYVTVCLVICAVDCLQLLVKRNPQTMILALGIKTLLFFFFLKSFSLSGDKALERESQSCLLVTHIHTFSFFFFTPPPPPLVPQHNIHCTDTRGVSYRSRGVKSISFSVLLFRVSLTCHYRDISVYLEIIK